MGLLDKANKRRCYPVVLTDRTVYVRSLKRSEIKRMNAIDEDYRVGFLLGMCLTLEDGKPEIIPTSGECDAEFSERVRAAFDAADVDSETVGQITQAIGKIGRVDVEAIAKN